MSAILVLWPGPFEKTIIPHSQDLSAQCCIQFNFFNDIGQSVPKKKIWIIWTNSVVLKCPMLYTMSQSHRPIGSEEEDFMGFNHILAWRPTWSCEQDNLNKLSFPHPKDYLHEIGLWLAQRFPRRCFKMLTDDYLHYKLTNELSAQVS